MLLSLAAIGAADDPALAKIRKDLEAARKKHGVPGMSVAIVRDGKVIFAEGFGYRDAAKRLPVTPDTIFAIGSCTKAFTGLLAAQAANEGKLALTDSPHKYLPSFHLKDPATDAKITLSDMLSHRSGLPRTDLAWYTNAFSRDELLRIVGEVEPTAKLGEKWQYQNLMFLFSGMTLEKVYGKPYETLLAERYFTPLGMTRTGSTYREFMAARERSVGYLPTGADSDKHPVAFRDIDVVAPAGSIVSTANDMAKYVRMLLADGEFEGKTLFAKDAIAETRKTRMAVVAGTMVGYGYGWMLYPWEGRQLVEHGGNIDGFNAEVALVPSEKLGVVVLTNVSASPLANQAALATLKSLLPPSKDAQDEKAPKTAKPDPKTPAPTFTKEDEAPDSSMGVYRLEAAKIDLRFYRQGGKTFVEQGGVSFPLTLIARGKYRAETSPQKATFTFAPAKDDPKKTEVTFEAPSVKLPLTPVPPYKASMEGWTLLEKMTEARGGATAIRNHPTAVYRYRARLLSDGVEIVGIRYAKPFGAADFSEFFGLGRQFAESHSFRDAHTSASMNSFAPPAVKPSSAGSAEVLEENNLADLDARKWYKSAEIVREDKVWTEEVYVLKKLPREGGGPLYDFVSKKSFLVLRRVMGDGPAASNAEYSDYRNVDGLVVPFHMVTWAGESGKTVVDIVSVDFKERVPDWPFRVPDQTATPL